MLNFQKAGLLTAAFTASWANADSSQVYLDDEAALETLYSSNDLSEYADALGEDEPEESHDLPEFDPSQISSSMKHPSTPNYDQ